MEDAEFEAALADAVSKGAPELTGTPLAEPEVVEEAPTAEAEPETEAVEEPAAEEPEAPQFGDQVQAYLGKYGGDVGKALEAAIHAQAKLGEQGNELGELRRMVQEMYEDRDQRPAQTPTTPFLSEADRDAIIENPSAAAQWARANNRPDVMDFALREWYEQDPYGASSFQLQQAVEVITGTVQQHVQPTLETVAEREKARAVSDAHRNLTAKYPDFQQVLETATPDEVAGIDRNLLAMAQEQNPQAALEFVYRWVAMGRGQQQAAQTAQKAEETRQQKREAAVVTAEETHVTTEPTTMEKLKEFMTSPDSWSVSDSLTR